MVGQSALSVDDTTVESAGRPWVPALDVVRWITQPRIVQVRWVSPGPVTTGQKGHYRRDCPKLQGNQSKGRGEASRPVQGRGQTSTPRVYELSKDVDGARPFQAINGNTLDYYFYNSSRIAWYGT